MLAAPVQTPLQASRAGDVSLATAATKTRLKYARVFKSSEVEGNLGNLDRVGNAWNVNVKIISGYKLLMYTILGETTENITSLVDSYVKFRRAIR
jgi:hypothetical protein